MTDTNPRAFPSAAIDDRFGGLTLLDYFAGKALTALTAHPNWMGMPFSLIAADSYDLAKAMLDERAKRDEGA